MRNNANVISKEFFQVSLVTYLLLTMAETLHEGFVSNFFNMSWLLLVVLVTGVVMVLTEPAESALGQAKERVAQGAVRAQAAARKAVPLGGRHRSREFGARGAVLDLTKVELKPKSPPRLTRDKKQLG